MNRTRDPERVNSLAGADLSELVASPLHVCLIDGDSLGIFAWRGPAIYEIHLAYQVRGRAAWDLFKAMLDTMREEYGARLFWTLIPVGSRNVRLFARIGGLLSDGFVTTQHGPQELFVSEKCGCHP